MRDLTARLREVVQRERARTGALTPDGGSSAGHAGGARELTYVPEPGVDAPGGAAASLQGRPLDANGACVVIDRRWSADRSHGRRTIDACIPAPGAPIEVFDSRIRSDREWWRRVVFFDIETTGLSGGAGTLAFLTGCGWFDDTGFVVRQFLLAGPAGEHAMLEALGHVFREASLIVTYNGRTFDVPFMETRWAFHRQPAPTDDLPHFDMLPPARRLWRQRDDDGDSSGCSLTMLERAVLGFHRIGDVPGFEIPARYFQFLRSGDPAAIEGVLEHNRHDLVSLAVLMSHALWLVQEGPDACRTPGEQLALGTLYARAGRGGAAREAYERAADSADRGVRRRALAQLALLFRRERRFDEAAEAWQAVLDLSDPGRDSLHQQAAEALAIHHEHRRKDVPAARRYAETLARGVSGRRKLDVDHRLDRINRKLANRQSGLLAD
jgi:uncharacterized protein YprB with RNaseH-like and TPR domain